MVAIPIEKTREWEMTMQGLVLEESKENLDMSQQSIAIWSAGVVSSRDDGSIAWRKGAMKAGKDGRGEVALPLNRGDQCIFRGLAFFES